MPPHTAGQAPDSGGRARRSHPPAREHCATPQCSTGATTSCTSGSATCWPSTSGQATSWSWSPRRPTAPASGGPWRMPGSTLARAATPAAGRRSTRPSCSRRSPRSTGRRRPARGAARRTRQTTLTAPGSAAGPVQRDGGDCCGPRAWRPHGPGLRRGRQPPARRARHPRADLRLPHQRLHERTRRPGRTPRSATPTPTGSGACPAPPRTEPTAPPPPTASCPRASARRTPGR